MLAVKIRGSAYQIFERYLVLAREASTSGDRIAVENFYQHAEHYFRINNARREGNQQGTPRPTTPADVEMNSSEADSREVDVDRFQPRWDGEASASPEVSTPLNQTQPTGDAARTSAKYVTLANFVVPGQGQSVGPDPRSRGYSRPDRASQ